MKCSPIGVVGWPVSRLGASVGPPPPSDESVCWFQRERLGPQAATVAVATWLASSDEAASAYPHRCRQSSTAAPGSEAIGGATPGAAARPVVGCVVVVVANGMQRPVSPAPAQPPLL